MEPDVQKKRRLSEDSEDYPVRSSKVLRTERQPFNICSFSDEILLLVMKKLDALTLCKLAQTCVRLRSLARDKTLWQHVDLTDEPLQGDQIFARIFRDVCAYTELRSLKLRGMYSQHPLEVWKNQTVSSYFLQHLDLCPHLESLSISEGCFDISKVMVVHFPKRLKSFNVDNCVIICTTKRNTGRDMSFFAGINTHMLELQQLRVENCNWFDTHDLIAFSKLPNLRMLSLRGCNTFKECVPYGSIATRFGFRALQVLDVRNTPVTDSDIQCFNMTKTLRELRLQCPEVKEKPEREGVPDNAEAGPSGEPPPRPTEPPTLERQVINLHFRRHVENDPQDNVNVLPGDMPNVNLINVAENNENGAEFQAGGNVRINIRNRNVQGRNVIHIVVRNNHHNCNNRGPNDGEGPPANQPNGERREENPAPVEEPERDPEPDQPPGPEPAGAQHYIMIRGFRDNPPADGAAGGHEEEMNAGRIVQFIQFERSLPMHMNANPATLITDRGICSFGQSAAANPLGQVWIRMEQRDPNTALERIIVRDYKLVTDASLQHLASCAPNLKYIDVVGTEVTKDGIDKFKLEKPECQVESNFGTGS